MKNLIKITLLAAIFVIFGCGDDQTNQQKQSAQEEQAVPAAVTPATSTATETETTETTVTPPADMSYQKPPWAILEQNVYYYPETKE